MKVRMKRLSVASFLLIGLFNFCSAPLATECYLKLKNISSVSKGRWSSDCDNLEGVKIDDNLRAAFTVNSNQIVINAVLKQDARKVDVVDVYFDSPLDLGRGGMNLDWRNFSQSISIALIRMRDRNNFDLNWIGFYDRREGLRKWVTQPEFYKGNGGAINFHRCVD